MAARVGLLGGGDAVALFRSLKWLGHLRIFYWGDMDTHGFEALSLLRTDFPHTVSIMMEQDTYGLFQQFASKAAPYTSKLKLRLSESENALFSLLNGDGKLLEQERIDLRYAENQLRNAICSKA